MKKIIGILIMMLTTLCLVLGFVFLETMPVQQRLEVVPTWTPIPVIATADAIGNKILNTDLPRIPGVPPWLDFLIQFAVGLAIIFIFIRIGKHEDRKYWTKELGITDWPEDE